MEENIILIKVIDREDQTYEIEAPTDMNMNLMEICKAYDLPVKGTCGGMAMCASCHCYVESEHEITGASDDEEDMLDQAFFVENNSRLPRPKHPMDNNHPEHTDPALSLDRGPMRPFHGGQQPLYRVVV